MKSFLILLLATLISKIANATNRDSSRLFWCEASVFSTRTASLSTETLLSGYNDIPNYFNDYSEMSFISKHYAQDSFESEISYMKYPYSQVDFRNTTIGVSGNLKKWASFSLDHSIGVNLSKADYKFNYNIKEFSSVNILTYDTLGRDSTGFMINNYIEGYKKIRRIGLVYQNAIRTNQNHRFGFAAILRHTLHFTFSDILYLKESKNAYSFTTYYAQLYWLDETEYSSFNLSGVSLYDKEQPSKDFSEHTRKNTFQYDALFILQPSLRWGANKTLETYLSLGTAVGMHYGKDYSSLKGGAFYGFGVGYRI